MDRIEVWAFAVWLPLAAIHEWPSMSGFQRAYVAAAAIVFTTFYGLLWLFDKAREYAPEVAGGFIAYVLHLIYHAIWRRPGHWLLRLITRKEKH